MKNNYIFAVLMCGLMLLTACEKEDLNNQPGIPEGAILLTTEGFQDHGAKTSVNGNTVQWVDNDQVYLNGNPYTVKISDDKAYVKEDNSLSGSTVYGFYNCGYTSSGSTTPTVTIPESYTCSMSGDRQVIALPMAAYNASGNSTLQFKHLTAAVNVTIWNNTGSTLNVERVVVKSNGNRLNGSVGLNLANDNMGLAASYTDVSAATDSIVEVIFSSPMTIATGEGNAKSIQVPILPIAEGNITVEVYCHNSSDWLKFSHRASNPALGRNKMLTAKTKITAAGTDHVTSWDVIDLRLLNDHCTIPTGKTLTGTLANNIKISIAAGATVTLSDATINGVHNYSCNWAGLSCIGDATIVLADGTTNTVKGFRNLYPGIHIPNGNTVTIQGETAGTGTLNATSNGDGAGIGGGFEIDCGNILIKSGIINATGGGSYAAGIGCGYYTNHCGNIVIQGGTVTAIAGNMAAGIGSSMKCSCGNIEIQGGTVVATGGSYAAGIGTGYGQDGEDGHYEMVWDDELQCEVEGAWIEGTPAEPSYCGTITISGGTIDATGGFMGAGIGTGEIGNCGNITITDGVTRVTATKGTYADHSIGTGSNGYHFSQNSYTVTIGGVEGKVSTSPYTYQP